MDSDREPLLARRRKRRYELRPPADCCANARSDGCAVAIKEKPVPHFDEILTKFAAALPQGDWETRVENWEEQLRIVQQARPNAGA